MNKIYGAVWFDKIGIVAMNNGYEDKAYIGIGQAVDENKDIAYILKTGKPFPIDAAKIMIRW